MSSAKDGKAQRAKNSMLGMAHAMQAMFSLLGILALPVAILQTGPEAPMARPLWWLRNNLEPGTFSLVRALGSLALWLLILSRIYDLRAIARCWKRALRDKDAPLASKECIRLD
ncbi:MAG: hypothetical protein ACO1TE_05315 [Prosthecobacter sp.]